MKLNFFLLPELNLPSKSWTRARDFSFLLFKKFFYHPLSRGMLAFKMVFTTPKSGQKAVLPLTIRCRWWEMGSEWVSYNPLSLVLPQEVRDGKVGLATRGQSHTRVESWRFIISNDGVKWVWVRWLSYPKKILAMRWNQSPRNIFSHSLFFLTFFHILDRM